ncbi:MAG: hypothetical protein JWN04_6023, partial [Myxococcaceae bacterium]|nr:hypothetical protein [Myxococcaceae bacterium]
MCRWRQVTRLVCTWLACAMLGVAVAPSAVVRLPAPVEQHASPAASNQCAASEQTAESGTLAPAAPAAVPARSTRMQASRRPGLVSDVLVRAPRLFLR